MPPIPRGATASQRKPRASTGTPLARRGGWAAWDAGLGLPRGHRLMLRSDARSPRSKRPIAPIVVRP